MCRKQQTFLVFKPWDFFLKIGYRFQMWKYSVQWPQGTFLSHVILICPRIFQRIWDVPGDTKIRKGQPQLWAESVVGLYRVIGPTCQKLIVCGGEGAFEILSHFITKCGVAVWAEVFFFFFFLPELRFACTLETSFLHSQYFFSSSLVFVYVCSWKLITLIAHGKAERETWQAVVGNKLCHLWGTLLRCSHTFWISALSNISGLPRFTEGVN